MSKETNHLHDVIGMLTKLSDHYKDNSLEWAQKKEQYAAEWDELLHTEDTEEYPKEVCNCVDDCIC